MRVLMTGRHVKVTPALKRYVEERLERLNRYGTTVGDVQVIIAVEKYRHAAEAKLTLNGVAIQAKASTNEMYASIDLVLDKIARQVAKRKEKLVSHKSRKTSQAIETALANPRSGLPQMTTVKTALPVLTLDEALERLAEEPASIFVFLSASADRVQVLRRVGNGGVELIDPRPAAVRKG